MICALHGKLTSYKEKEQSKRRKKKLIAKRQRAQKQRERVIGCESLIPRPIQNFYSIPHPNLKLDVFAKSFPTHPDISPQATRISTSSQLGSPPPPPPPPILLQFSKLPPFSKVGLLDPKMPKPFFKQGFIESGQFPNS